MPEVKKPNVTTKTETAPPVTKVDVGTELRDAALGTLKDELVAFLHGTLAPAAEDLTAEVRADLELYAKAMASEAMKYAANGNAAMLGELKGQALLLAEAYRIKLTAHQADVLKDVATMAAKVAERVVGVAVAAIV